ncbi:MAG: outer membrane lipoprotein-sorting protein [bacterium]|nr:outer membrane lipoprotein-sorting protein [bacterium]
MKKISMFSLIMLLAVAMFAEGVDEIIKKAHMAAYYQGDDGKGQLLMKVYAKGSDKPIKKLFYMLRHDIEEGGKQMFFLYFVRPSDIKKTTFLVHKYIDKDDFRRLYIPASDKVIPIAGNRKQDPFMGSDFTYEDVSGRHFSKDNHKLLGDESMMGHDCHVTESVPKVKENKTAKLKAWIDKKTYMPIRVDFYNHDGKVYRSYESRKVEDVGGFPTIMERVMTSPLKGTKTIIVVNPKKVEYNVGMGEKIFSERSLKNPPMKYLK